LSDIVLDQPYPKYLLEIDRSRKQKEDAGAERGGGRLLTFDGLLVFEDRFRPKFNSHSRHLIARNLTFEKLL
jgi:hypothetical protein